MKSLIIALLLVFSIQAYSQEESEEEEDINSSLTVEDMLSSKKKRKHNVLCPVAWNCQE
jgi:hypothetical protein